MKVRGKVAAILLSVFMLLGIITSVYAEPTSLAGLPDGAVFEAIGAEHVDATVYSYAPSKLYSPSQMMTPVIFVYPDEAYASIEDAWSEFCALGFLEIAEAERAGVLMVNPVGSTWGEADDAIYEQLLDTICPPGRGAMPVLAYTTYCDLLYAIGEGSGATFINEYLTRELRATLISGVLTFGGEMTENVTTAEDTVALPAYLVGASDEAIAFYQTINSTDAEEAADSKNIYYDSDYTTKKVVVSASNTVEFNKDTISDAWYSMLRRICRNGITTSAIWNDGHKYMAEREGQYLMDRPIVDELGLTYNAELYDEAVSFQSRWYEWVPNEVYDTIADANDATVYPLVMLYHGGGDHPIFEAEQDGWVQVAADERIILVAPENNTDTANNIAFIDYICEKYPVDASRIYICGFSIGSRNARLTATEYIDKFAALALLSPPKDLGQTIEFEEAGWDADAIDLPVWFSTGTSESGKPDPENPNAPIFFSAYSLVNDALELNNIDAYIDGEAFDLEAYPYIGHDNSENTSYYTNKFGITISDTVFYTEAEVPMVGYTLIYNGFHNHWTGLAEMAWDFVSGFSRDLDTNEIFYASK